MHDVFKTMKVYDVLLTTFTCLSHVKNSLRVFITYIWGIQRLAGLSWFTLIQIKKIDNFEKPICCITNDRLEGVGVFFLQSNHLLVYNYYYLRSNSPFKDSIHNVMFTFHISLTLCTCWHVPQAPDVIYYSHI